MAYKRMKRQINKNYDDDDKAQNLWVWLEDDCDDPDLLSLVLEEVGRKFGNVNILFFFESCKGLLGPRLHGYRYVYRRYGMWIQKISKIADTGFPHIRLLNNILLCRV